MKLNINQGKLIYVLVLIFCFSPFVSPAIALALGIGMSAVGIRFDKASGLTSLVLQSSIVFMGFGMCLTEVLEASKSGFALTAVSVVFVMLCGFLLTKILKIDSKTGLLISAGTAICGGSAIAAVSPVLNAKNSQISFALIVVFVLNALALFIFPHIGHYFSMSQEAFGQWAAIAIHDTSSVVGAGAIYGEKALEVATTVKLIRALWIIPLSIVIAITQRGKGNGKIKAPWFIALFVLTIFVAHYLPQFSTYYGHMSTMGSKGMVLALFLIGSKINLADMKTAGIKSFVLGISLWFIIALTSLIIITQ